MAKTAITWEAIVKWCRQWPGVEVSTSYGTAALKVRGKLFIRLKEEGDVIVVRIAENDRRQRLQADPIAFFLTDHYVKHPWILVRFAQTASDELRELLADAWRLAAPKSLIDSKLD